MDGYAVFLRGHEAGQQIAVAGHQHHVGAGTVSGQFGQLGVHGGVDALLRPPPVTAGEGAQPNGHPGHDPQPAVLGLRDAVGCAVEPVDAQQGLFRVGLGALAQALDQRGVVDGDAGTGGLSGQQTRGCAQQVAGVHQDDATIHAFHPLPIRRRAGGPGHGGWVRRPGVRSLRVSFESARHHRRQGPELDHRRGGSGNRA